MKPETITIDGTTIELFTKLDEEDVFKGMTTFCGVPCHVYFIRVHNVEHPGYIEQEAVGDPYGRFGDLRNLDPEMPAFGTVEIPGYDGEYVLCLFPGEQ